LKAHFVASIN